MLHVNIDVIHIFRILSFHTAENNNTNSMIYNHISNASKVKVLSTTSKEILPNNNKKSILRINDVFLSLRPCETALLKLNIHLTDGVSNNKNNETEVTKITKL